MHKNNGYACKYMPRHPSARPNGYVYVHRLVMEEKLGRRLSRAETIHHKDGNRLNNSIDNLELISNREHVFRHRRERIAKACPVCGNMTRNIRFCSDACSHFDQRKVVNRPAKKELSSLIWKKSISEIARGYSVSDSCIRKWCLLYGIKPLPGRGYWQKVRAGKIELGSHSGDCTALVRQSDESHPASSSLAPSSRIGEFSAAG